MYQLILPFYDLLAERMEVALKPYAWWDKSSSKSASFAQAYMGNWIRPAGFFFSTADIERLMVMYDDVLYMHINRDCPWLQLFLPFPIYNPRDDENFNSEQALDDLLVEFNRMRESIGLEPKYRFRPQPRTSLFAPIDDC